MRGLAVPASCGALAMRPGRGQNACRPLDGPRVALGTAIK
jgi:hypothetical protein